MDHKDLLRHAQSLDNLGRTSSTVYIESPYITLCDSPSDYLLLRISHLHFTSFHSDSIYSQLFFWIRNCYDIMDINDALNVLNLYTLPEPISTLSLI